MGDGVADIGDFVGMFSSDMALKKRGVDKIFIAVGARIVGVGSEVDSFLEVFDDFPAFAVIDF